MKQRNGVLALFVYLFFMISVPWSAASFWGSAMLGPALFVRYGWHPSTWAFCGLVFDAMLCQSMGYWAVLWGLAAMALHQPRQEEGPQRPRQRVAGFIMVALMIVLFLVAYHRIVMQTPWQEPLQQGMLMIAIYAGVFLKRLTRQGLRK